MSDVDRQQQIVRQMNKMSNTQPPIVYGLLGIVCLAFWGLGTSVQVLTSEAWMMGRTMDKISFTAFGQLYAAFAGQLAAAMMIPFLFGWGVQLALIVSSIGVELPRKPEWRWWLAVGSCFVLIAANSCGDFAGSAQYGIWGQFGFTAVVFFLTFVMMLFAIMSFKKAFTLARLAQQQQVS
ncbi:MAG: hypothetical protein E6J34_15485 [Chloroflexi bacterium]|nr:MAG: hypothetical protein E6J34_15485 [Chloroflexota bacterium]